MALAFSLRALRPSLTPADGSKFICNACRRHESTARRTKKALRVKPDAAFVPSKTETQEHIIFNPPSSAPNVYHTPAKFLPKSDPRSKFYSTAPTSPESSYSPSRLKPVRPQYEKSYHLGKEQVEEIRKLRKEDPRKWTRVRLAEKFECSQFFISLCCSAPEIKQERDRQLEEIKRRWGRRKTEAREERQARKALWGRDA